MTLLQALLWTAFGLTLGIMGTLTWLAIQRWQPPKRVELDGYIERIRKLS